MDWAKDDRGGEDNWKNGKQRKTKEKKKKK